MRGGVAGDQDAGSRIAGDHGVFDQECPGTLLRSALGEPWQLFEGEYDPVSASALTGTGYSAPDIRPAHGHGTLDRQQNRRLSIASVLDGHIPHAKPARAHKRQCDALCSRSDNSLVTPGPDEIYADVDEDRLIELEDSGRQLNGRPVGNTGEDRRKVVTRLQGHRRYVGLARQRGDRNRYPRPQRRPIAAQRRSDRLTDLAAAAQPFDLGGDSLLQLRRVTPTIRSRLRSITYGKLQQIEVRWWVECIPRLDAQLAVLVNELLHGSGGSTGRLQTLLITQQKRLRTNRKGCGGKRGIRCSRFRGRAGGDQEHHDQESGNAPVQAGQLSPEHRPVVKHG